MEGCTCASILIAFQVIFSNFVHCTEDVETGLLREKIEVLRNVIKVQVKENIDWTKRLDILDKLFEEIKQNKENVLSRKIRGVDPRMGFFVGRQGPQGMPGTPGVPGTMGRRGVKGLKGIQGDAGLQGPQGPFGPPGWHGPPGFQGAIGIKGSKGEQGFDGHPGLIGDFGYVGFPGDPGFPGPPGFPGHTGFIGMNGMPGPKGDKGLTGPPGEKGETGFQGFPGPVGMYGEPGEIGELGITGPFGLAGPQGSKGERGYQGDNGDFGPVGAPGPVYNPYAGFLAAPRVSKSGPHSVQGAPASNCSNNAGSEENEEDLVNCEDLPGIQMSWVMPPFRHPPPAAHVMAAHGKHGQNQQVVPIPYAVPEHNKTVKTNESYPPVFVPAPLSKSNPTPMYGKAMYAQPMISKSQMGYAAGPDEDVVNGEVDGYGIPSFEDENKEILSEEDFYDDKIANSSESLDSEDASNSESDDKSESESDVQSDENDDVIDDVHNDGNNSKEEHDADQFKDTPESASNINGTQFTKLGE